MPVCGTQGRNIVLPDIASHRFYVFMAPCKTGTPQLLSQKIGGEAGMTAISVGEGVDQHQPVMKADRDFIGRIRVVLYPVFHIVQQLVQLRHNPIGIHADIAARFPAVFARPSPDVPEHLPVQAAQKLFIQHIALP